MFVCEQCQKSHILKDKLTTEVKIKAFWYFLWMKTVKKPIALKDITTQNLKLKIYIFLMGKKMPFQGLKNP